MIVAMAIGKTDASQKGIRITERMVNLRMQDMCVCVCVRVCVCVCVCV